jgi:cytochrome c-type biogenesis protein CcmH
MYLTKFDQVKRGTPSSLTPTLSQRERGGLLIVISAVAAISLGAYAPQQPGSAPLEPALEARVQELGKQLRCAVCQGLSIADSPASMARAQLDKVREMVAAGSSDEEIRDYFVERYGEWVLLQPRAAGLNWLVWLGPGALVVFGFAVILRQIRRSGREPPRPKPPQPVDATPDADEYLAKVRAELNRD